MLWNTYEDTDCREKSNYVNVLTDVWLNYKYADIKKTTSKLKHISRIKRIEETFFTYSPHFFYLVSLEKNSK
jgi:hypothetical protein